MIDSIPITILRVFESPELNDVVRTYVLYLISFVV